MPVDSLSRCPQLSFRAVPQHNSVWFLLRVAGVQSSALERHAVFSIECKGIEICSILIGKHSKWVQLWCSLSTSYLWKRGVNLLIACSILGIELQLSQTQRVDDCSLPALLLPIRWVSKYCSCSFGRLFCSFSDNLPRPNGGIQYTRVKRVG